MFYHLIIRRSGCRSALTSAMTTKSYNREYPIDFSKEQIKQVKMISMAIQDSFPLVPGSYRFSLLLQNTVSKEFTSLEREIIIPESREAFWMDIYYLPLEEKKIRNS
jgi:hypothetical protein